jgi:hypothetical protein
MKSNRWLLLFILILVLILTACNAKEDANSSANSEADRGNETSIEDSKTQTEEEEVKVVLLDAEAMLDTLGDYLLRPADLPEEYYIPEGGEQRLATIRLIQNMGEIEAKTYVKETGRIDGWWLEIQRKNKTDFVPTTFENSIELFDSEKGARSASSPDYYSLYQDEEREYTPVAGGCNLGDRCKFFRSEKEDPTTETMIVEYIVAYTYKNAFVWVKARGFDFDMDADYIRDAAGKIFTKLESAPTK